MAKYLIVNADDYGLCRSANEAVEELFETGKLKSSTVMMTARAAEDAVCFANNHPQYPIGVHLTMTSEWPNYRWKPLTDGKSLVDADGFMWRSSKDVAKNAKLDELEAEIRAQIERAHAMGMHPSHLDNHMGSLYGHQTGRFSLLKMTLRVCGEYGYAFRMFTSTDKRLCPRGVPYPIFRTLVLPSRIWSRRYGVVLPDTARRFCASGRIFRTACRRRSCTRASSRMRSSRSSAAGATACGNMICCATPRRTGISPTTACR